MSTTNEYIRNNMKKIINIYLIISLSLIAFSCSQNSHQDDEWKIRSLGKDETICFALYTVHNNILKLTAQLYELGEDADKTVRLEIYNNEKWDEIVRTQIDTKGWTAVFRIEKWDTDKNYTYRVVHGENSFFTGTIRRDPTEKDEIVVAAFTGNSNKYRGARPDIIKNIKYQDPDLLFFSGDQVYDHTTHFESWLLFGRQFGDIIKDRPTICIPDDHDVGNANLWGAGGKIGHDGYKDPDYVREVERAQTSNLPDPYDPTPIDRGIGVYYTDLTWGRIGFAIIEDRKFKSQVDVLDSMALAEAGVVFSREDHIEKVNDPGILDVPEATLLGIRQLKFLYEWGQDWTGTDMKAVLSQTIFCGGAHIHHDKRLKADLDSNGWPQSGRNRALAEMRRCFAFHIGGDQHLATVIHHGIEDWGDAGWSFCVPSILNFYPRKWLPEEKGIDPFEGLLPHTGDYFDGFGNRLTMFAYVNPGLENLHPPSDNGASGYGLIRFNKKSLEIVIECWPRGVDVSKPDAKQYAGFPVTIKQEDNYGKKAHAFLPSINVSGKINPRIQIRDDSTGEIVYTLRINGTSFRPKVFKSGIYIIIVGEGNNQQVLRNISTLKPGELKTLRVEL